MPCTAFLPVFTYTLSLPRGHLWQCCDTPRGVPDWMKYTHHVLELKESYPRQLCQCCPPQTCLLEGLERRNEGTMYL
ncbi:hypothetical protein MHYP_G00029970 [Metynnis hypsauchen]